MLRLMLIAVGTAFAAALLSLFGGSTQQAQGASAAALPACSAGQLVPVLGATTVNQGIGSYANAGQKLTRGKETLVRFFLTYQPTVGSTCSGTTFVRNASLIVKNSANSASFGPVAAYQSFGTSGTAIASATVSVDSNADPKFVIPASRLNSCLVDTSTTPCDDTAAGFTLGFSAAITFTTSLSATPQTTSLASPLSASIDRFTGGARILVIPMGDANQTYSSQLTTNGRTAISNGFAALSRMFPVAGGVASTLAPSSAGIRYKLDLAAMLNLRAISGAYDPNGKFCGTQATFDNAIKGQLATYLAVYNASVTDPAQRADRVLGVVDSAISDGSTSQYNCAEGMASTNSPEAWVRAIPDQPKIGSTPAKPSMTGALMAMELAHTFGLDETTSSFHSPNVQADVTSPDRAYNVSSRNWVADDRSVMRFVVSNPFNNNNAFLELSHFEKMLCKFGGSLTANCTAAIGGTTVAAGGTVAISGTTNFMQAGTNVVESFESNNDGVFAPDPASDLKLVVTPLAGAPVEIGIPYSTVSSEHLSDTHLNTTTAVFGGIFEAPAGIQKLELIHDGEVLYTRSADSTPPTPAGFSGVPAGSTVSIDKVVPTTAIPPKVDICLVQDETGSFGDDIATLNELTGGTLIPALDATGSDYSTCVVGFRDFAQDGWGIAGDWVYRRYADVSAGGAGFTAGVPQLTAVPGAGGDDPEGQLEALHYLATPLHPAINSNGNFDPDIGEITTDPEDTPAGRQPTWRAGAKRVALLATDNACHVTGDPPAPGWPGDAGTTSAAVTADLVEAAGITVIGLVPTVPWADACVNTLASGTGGSVHATASDSSTIVSAIMAGLGNLPVTVTPDPTCNAGLTLLFDGEEAAAAAKTVESGTDVTWNETATVAPSATPGTTLTCTVEFRVGEESIFTQNVSIQVSGDATIEFGIRAQNPSLIRAHGVYDCGDGDKIPAFVGVTPDAIQGNVAQFEANFDRSTACGSVTGPATLTIVGTNGVQSTTLTAAVAQLEVNVPPKTPVAAIYQPTLNVVNPVFKPFALNGHVTDPEDGDLVSNWTITGPGVSLTATGDVADVIPASGVWPSGDYTVTLSGTDSAGNIATATAIVHVVQYVFGGFVSPIDDVPTINTGRAGRTYPVKWLHTLNGSPVTDPDSIVAIRFAPMNCGLAPADALETTASGGTELRFDATQNLWVYNWRTPNAPGCYALTITLNDGSTHVALFKLS
jgi:hypothetical protein